MIDDAVLRGLSRSGHYTNYETGKTVIPQHLRARSQERTGAIKIVEFTKRKFVTLTMQGRPVRAVSTASGERKEVSESESRSSKMSVVGGGSEIGSGRVRRHSSPLSLNESSNGVMSVDHNRATSSNYESSRNDEQDNQTPKQSRPHASTSTRPRTISSSTKSSVHSTIDHASTQKPPSPHVISPPPAILATQTVTKSVDSFCRLTDPVPIRRASASEGTLTHREQEDRMAFIEGTERPSWSLKRAWGDVPWAVEPNIIPSTNSPSSTYGFPRWAPSIYPPVTVPPPTYMPPTYHPIPYRPHPTESHRPDAERLAAFGESRCGASTVD
ncbi:hypothetical protein BC829DRAFT_42614 [Chytridium lagenaria]|nr:hypothetical protein BC829DRAFT_42614 [Chytridium lagenaria]